MNHTNDRNLTFGRLFMSLVIIVFTSYTFVGCELIRKMAGCKECSSSPTSAAQTPPPNSVNLSLSANISDSAIKNRLVNSFTPAKFTSAEIVVRRCKCDKDLINIALPNTFTIVINGSEGPLVVKSGDGATGGDVDLPLSGKGANYSLSPSIPERDSGIKYSRAISELIKTSTYNPDKTVSIAIFDTGLDISYLNGTTWQKSVTQCSTAGGTVATTSLTGLNFTNVGTEGNTADDSPVQHGSRVANLIARQFNNGPITPKIVPMKVLAGPNNQGDLFELMCAMETARKNNIQVFNMSLGYYGVEDPLLREYVKRAVNDKIVLVMAVGNRTDSTNVDRNFSTMTDKFYPAGFSMNFDRAMAVTTVRLHGTSPTNDTLVGCPLQNYGPLNVLGVLQQADCRFEFVPGDASASAALIEGSSYATPVMTGWVARKIGENPAQIIKWPTLHPMMKKAKHGQQLYKNAYIIPEASSLL